MGRHNQAIAFSMNNDPLLTGPDKSCLISGGVIEEFSGGGNPETDVYIWKIISPSNQVLFEDEGRASYQNIRYTFSLQGTHTIELEVERGGKPIYSDSKKVQLLQGPSIVLKSSYYLCQGQEIELQAIDPSSPNFNDYVFEWKNSAGTVVSTQNSLKTSTLGEYSVTFYFINANGEAECTSVRQTTLSPLTDVAITKSKTSLCPGDYISFHTDPPTKGQWEFQKIGTADKIPAGTAAHINLSSVIDLAGPGDYQVFFTADNPSNPACSIAKQASFTFYDRPEFEFLDATASSGCLDANGALTLKALTQIDQLSIKGNVLYSNTLYPGDEVTLPNLKSGIYAITASLGNCTNTSSTVVPLDNPPEQLKFEIEDLQPEVCTPTGKLDGSFVIKMVNAGTDAKYKVIDERGNEILGGETENKKEILVNIHGGIYYVELFEEDICTLPRAEKVVIPSLEQVDFTIPNQLNVCQSYELFPESKADLAYEITHLDENTVSTIAPGESFTITKGGSYEIIGTLPGQSEICPTLKTFEVQLVDPVDFEIKQIEEDCFGNQRFMADIFGRDPETVTFKWYNEENELVSQDQYLVPYSYGEFKLDVQPANSTSCPIPPKTKLIEKPILKVDLDFDHTKLCDLGPGSNISLIIDKPEAVTDIIWRRFDGDGNTEDLTEFTNKTNITVTEPGIYEASAYSIIPDLNKDCPLGINTFQIEVTPDLVDFDVLPDISICETYDYTPITDDEAMVFEIIRPDKTKIEIKAGESVTLDQNGDYSFFGYNPDLDYPLCPRIKTMTVDVKKKVNFTPELFQKSCDGEHIYKANIGNVDPEQVLFYWYNSNKVLLGNEQFLTLNTQSQNGDFYLDVHPKESLPCDQEMKLFEVDPPVFSVPITLVPDPLCPDATAAAIQANADFSLVHTIRWWYIDPDGLEIELPAARGKDGILAINEGTYEARLYNDIECLLGTDRVLILRSTDPIRPELEEEYQICPKYNIGPTINPGTFASYEWFYQGSLVATTPTFKPQQVGEYSLIVYSNEGCAYQADFTTEEECELKVTYPNAIQPANPEKHFLVYTNYLVDEVEVSIFNKWGQMVFQCSETDLISEKSTCFWDGRYNDKPIPNGTYAVRFNYKNYEKGISNKKFGSILVIE